MESFVYIWENIVSGKRYIGSHKGTPDDGYIASCKPFLEDYTVAPHLFKRTIMAKGNYNRMLELETSMLKMADAKNNPTYYNMHNGDGKFYNKRHTEEAKAKMRGRVRSEEHCKNISKAQTGIKRAYSPRLHRRGKPTWNSGLTKDVDTRVKAPRTAFKKGHIPWNKRSNIK